MALDEISIRVSGYAYVVGLDGQTHTIYRGLSCSCGQDDCEAGRLVVEWLGAGNEKAPVPPIGFTPYLPKACPICGSQVTADHSLDSRTRGIGWRCTKNGTYCYWTHKWNTVKGWFFRECIIPGYLKREDVPDKPEMGYLLGANR